MNIKELKQNLMELHPLTRIIKINELIKRTDNKKLKEELKKILEQTNKEIEDKNIIFNLGAFPQQTKRTFIEEPHQIPQQRPLEQVVAHEAPVIPSLTKNREEETPDTSYQTLSSDYERGYERQRELEYEREHLQDRRETLITNRPLTFEDQSTKESEEKIKYKTLNKKNGTGY